ncbi:MAG: hypothetical protein ACTHON_18205 [Humibacter sp.]
MSDLHTMPLRGRDLDYAPQAPERHKAHVWLGMGGWWWEHQCSIRHYEDFGSFASPGDAYDAAVRHLKGCCR